MKKKEVVMREPEEMSMADIRAMFAEIAKQAAEWRAEEDKRRAEEERQAKIRRAEEERQAKIRRAEEERQAKIRRAEEDKRRAEEDKRRAEEERQAKIRRAEEDKRRAEEDKRRAEAEEELRKWKEENDKVTKEWNRRLGGIDDNIGHHAEQFFQDTLAKVLTFGGEKYDKILNNVQGSDKTTSVEFDILLVNGKSVAIIEAKNRIHPKNVTEMTDVKLLKFRRFFPEYQKHKVYLGLAGFSFSQKAREDALKHGVGIIKQTGDSIEVDAGHLKAY